jgi:TMEM175 potassium channel family protein
LDENYLRFDVNNRGGEDTRGLDRIIFFSDAVFAIVMTLLILDISVPDIPQDSATAELPGRVLDLWPEFFSYTLSFLVIGTYWMAHHGTFGYFRSYDRMLMWLNLLFLLSISFVPFPTALLGEYGEQQFPVVLYALSLAIPRLLLALVWWYATKRNLLIENLDPKISRYHLARSLAIPALFLLSIIVSFFSVSAAILSWLLLFAVDALLWRLQWYR